MEESEQFGLAYVEEQKERPMLFFNHSTLNDEHLKHVVFEDEKEEHQAASPYHSELDEEDYELEEFSVGPEQWTEDIEREEDVEVSIGCRGL